MRLHNLGIDMWWYKDLEMFIQNLKCLKKSEGN